MFLGNWSEKGGKNMGSGIGKTLKEINKLVKLYIKL